MQGMPPQISTSGKRSERGATCLFLQFADSATAMHFAAVNPLLHSSGRLPETPPATRPSAGKGGVVTEGKLLPHAG
jgi:hypothetical protein